MLLLTKYWALNRNLHEQEEEGGNFRARTIKGVCQYVRIRVHGHEQEEEREGGSVR